MTSGPVPAPTEADTEAPACAGERVAHHVHAVLHCNLNTMDVERAALFHLAAFGGEPRMRSISVESDATAMGLGPATSSVTTFLYDLRGPRAAPALELVGWSEPRTRPGRPDQAPSGFTAIGYRIRSLRGVAARLAAIGCEAVPMPDGLTVRGRRRPALLVTDPDGVAVEVVEIAPAPTDPPSTGVLSHERMRCTDLDRTIAWYAGIGWQLHSRGQDRTDDAPPLRWASLVIPEDPTFSLEFAEEPVPTGQAPRPANTQGLYRIALAVGDVDEAFHSLRAAGHDVPPPVTLSMPDIPTGGFTVLFLADPDGAVVELVGRPRSAVRRPQAPT